MECSLYFSVQELFDCAASSSDYTTLNSGMLSEELIGKDVKEEVVA